MPAADRLGAQRPPELTALALNDPRSAAASRAGSEAGKPMRRFAWRDGEQRQIAVGHQQISVSRTR